MKATSWLLVWSLSLIGGCASHPPAPVEHRGEAPAQVKSPTATAPVADGRSVFHTVKKGDTLYSVALDHGQDYKDVAAWNYLDNPNVIRIGQQLRVSPPEGAPVAVTKPVIAGDPVEVKSVSVARAAPPSSGNTESLKREPKGGKLAYSDEALAKARHSEAAERPLEAKSAPRPTEPTATEKPAASGDDVEWMWPASGSVIAPFSESGSKGLDIAGKAGDPVFAAGNGIVSYAGAGLRGYGNLVVLRHNATYLSVYAHNSKILVKEKQAVAKGQKIAEMGSTDAESPRLHFEIRRQGKPADPQKFLPIR